MHTSEQINEIHRLRWIQQWPLRKIARPLRIGRRTIARYLDTPAPAPAQRDRASKLDSFKPAMPSCWTRTRPPPRRSSRNGCKRWAMTATAPE